MAVALSRRVTQAQGSRVLELSKTVIWKLWRPGAEMYARHPMAVGVLLWSRW